MTEDNTNSIYKFTVSGSSSTFATGLSSPAGLAFDGSGNLFVANYNYGTIGAGTIFKFAPSGSSSTFATGLSGPGGLAFDSSGNLFEADSLSGTIYKFTPNGRAATRRPLYAAVACCASLPYRRDCSVVTR